MRVAIDAAPLLEEHAGVTRYVHELARALGARGVEVVPYAVSLRGEARPGIARWRVPARAARTTWRRFGRPPLERLVGDVDVVHGTNFVLPALERTPGVVTIHDLGFLRDDAFPGAHRLRQLVPWSVGRAGAVLAPTRVVADELASELPVERADIHVTPEGVAPSFFGATPLSEVALARLGVRPPFALAVGTLQPRKNIAGLVDAWRIAARDLPGWNLVLAGSQGWGPAVMDAPRTVRLGHVAEETLPGLVAAAALFCFPSLYEGFGLPPLEAMAAGTPVVAARYSAAAEVLGDAALLVEAGDAEALAAAIVAVATDEARRGRMRFAGKAQAAAFTWESTAAATIGAYRAALEAGR